MRLNDCNGYTHVWVGFVGDADPLSTDPGDGTYPGWVACSVVQSIDSPLLNTDALNNLRLWFRTGGVVSSYTYDIPVTHSSGDQVPPAIPGITLNTGDPTSDSFARFTIANCADIAGVYVGVTGSAPLGSQNGWQDCTLSAQAILSHPLTPGLNNISVWFKDAANNVTISSDYNLVYNEPAITDPAFYLTMDDAQVKKQPTFSVKLLPMS